MFCFSIRKLFFDVSSQNSVIRLTGLYSKQFINRFEICRLRILSEL